MDHRNAMRGREGPDPFPWWLRLLPWALAFVAVSLGAAWLFRNIRAAVIGLVVVLLYAAWKRRRERRVQVAAAVVAMLLVGAVYFLAGHIVDNARQRGSWSNNATVGRSDGR